MGTDCAAGNCLGDCIWALKGCGGKESIGECGMVGCLRDCAVRGSLGVCGETWDMGDCGRI